MRVSDILPVDKAIDDKLVIKRKVKRASFIYTKPVYGEFAPKMRCPGSLWELALEKGTAVQRLWEYDFTNNKTVLIGYYEHPGNDEIGKHKRCTQLADIQEVHMFIDDANRNKVQFRLLSVEDWKEYNIAVYTYDKSHCL